MGINDFPMRPPKSVEQQLADALVKIEKYKAVIREYRRCDLEATPTPPPGTSNEQNVGESNG
jgi:hypothetical protein